MIFESESKLSQINATRPLPANTVEKLCRFFAKTHFFNVIELFKQQRLKKNHIPPKVSSLIYMNCWSIDIFIFFSESRCGAILYDTFE